VTVATGRPRVAGTDQLVIDTVLDLLGEGSTLAGLSFVAIAARAGVSRNTLYRRWRTKDELLLDVLTAVNTPWPTMTSARAITNTHPRKNLISLVETLFERAGDPRVGRLLRCLIAESEQFPQLRVRYAEAVITPRRQAMREVLEHGIRSGHLRAGLDTDVAVLALSAPALFYGLTDTAAEITAGQSPHALATRLVDLILHGLADL